MSIDTYSPFQSQASRPASRQSSPESEIRETLQSRTQRSPQDRQRKQQKTTRPQPPPIQRPTTSFDWVRTKVRSFMACDTASPIQWLLDLRTYGLKIHYNTTAVGHANWKDKQTLEYKNIRFTMDEFRGMVQALVAKTRQALLEDVLFVEHAHELPAVPWDVLHDDSTNGEVGWNFMDDQRSRLPVAGMGWLYERIRSKEELQDRFVREGNDQA
ncbi:hypothetical protein LTR09_012553 [Extremus antarcticus]|uniref:Uncharacterized protein n=1 Tax=Extremus antarcticus TaxID=702011 RepID=A0AAJ0D4Y0_9PEZI|nr:hypothetical protein LTR09_012553 [Extremus antarcticus]